MQNASATPLDEVFRSIVDQAALDALLDAAMREDFGEAGDLTSESIIEPTRRGKGVVAAREPGVVCGMKVVARMVERYAASGALASLGGDGEQVQAGRAVARLEGSLRELLGVERTMLNFLGRLSGIATLTRRYVDAVAGTSAVICDTRKTTPGWRHLEKYAVYCGGGTLHRIGLNDAALYKDNHLAHIPPGKLADALSEAIRRARQAHELSFVEVEVDSLAQLDQVLAIGPGLVDIVLLDNFSLDDLRAAVKRRDERQSQIKLEASGGVSFETVRHIAETGVDRIAIGALTHSAPSLDFGLDIT